jgi:RimJ/RimL family protein N-acetyltransferase
MLDTSRLLLRPPRASDAEAFFSFLGDAEAMRFTHHPASLRECRRRLAAFEWKRRQQGYAPWAIVQKDDQQLVGWGGLYEDPFDPGWGVELGYSFHPAAWGQGYGTELAYACMAWADDALKLPEVRAFAHPENTASQRVLTKAGFMVVRLIPKMNRLLFMRVSARHR